MAVSRKNSKLDRVMDTLFGGNVPKKIPPLYKIIAECLATPELLPNKIEEIINDKMVMDMRIPLARVQIDSELRMREDVEYFSRRLWATQTIERMVFGGLIVEGEKLKDEDEED